jgi:hypothetical protein
MMHGRREEASDMPSSAMESISSRQKITIPEADRDKYALGVTLVTYEIGWE